MSDTAFRPVEEMSFKQMLDELEAIVRQREGNELELEESLRCYERGVELLRVSRIRLGDAQQKVVSLLGELEVSGDDESTDTELS